MLQLLTAQWIEADLGLDFITLDGAIPLRNNWIPVWDARGGGENSQCIALMDKFMMVDLVKDFAIVHYNYVALLAIFKTVEDLLCETLSWVSQLWH